MILYDTCSLLNHFDEILQRKEKFAVSSVTINELEHIKVAANKDFDVKARAAQISRWFYNNPDHYENILYNVKWDKILEKHGYLIENDSRIFATAYYNRQLEFATDDRNCEALARALGVPIRKVVYTIDDEYHGYKIISSDDDLGLFYDELINSDNNYWHMCQNEYLLIQKEDKIVDSYKWCGNGYSRVGYTKCLSTLFGELKPKDMFQRCALDSFNKNQITVLKGKAGSGKSLLSVAYLFDKLEHGDIDKIIMFVNPVATKGAAKLGFLPGDKNQKILDSQIGNFLISKIGDRFVVEKLIEDGKLFLVPMSDCRGFDTSGMNAGIYVTEAQNMSVDMMKLLLQRIGEDCICILEGDVQSQVDMAEYAGKHNGMRRLSEVFRGEDYYGEIELNNCYRSKIANRAELM